MLCLFMHSHHGKILYGAESLRSRRQVFVGCEENQEEVTSSSYIISTRTLCMVFLRLPLTALKKFPPRAWDGRYPAQVKVSIHVDQLREISNAHQRL